MRSRATTRHSVTPTLALALGAMTSPAVAQTAVTSSAGQATTPTTRIIVFGDSLADGGFYLPLDPRIPRDAGSFTTNPDPVAPEVFAAQFGLPLLPVYGQGGTNHAVGGARVAAASGLAIPIATQITNFLVTGPTIAPTDLFYIQGGGNDYFAFLAGGGRDPTILTNAATQLATQVGRLQSAGARRIVTLSVQSAGSVPVQQFNASYKAALAAANVNALFVDIDGLFNEILTSPATFGITNVTQNACTVASSLNCNRSTLVTPNANETYARADDVHPTGIVTRIEGQLIASLVRAPDQIADLGYAARAGFRSQRDLLDGAIGVGVGVPRGDDAGGAAVFGTLGYHYATRGGDDQQTGFTERGPNGTLGVDLELTANAGVGIAAAYGEGNGSFDGRGGYRSKYYSITGYGRALLGPLHVSADATYGRVHDDRITRTVVLGPSLRTSNGRTRGDYFAARIAGSVLPVEVGGVGIGPEASVTYERIALDGFAETGTLSSDASFGGQRLHSLTGRFGVLAATAPASPVRFVARAAYVREFDDKGRTITITPVGAPIAYTTGVARADRDYLSGAMSVEGTIAGALSVRGGVATEVARGGFDRVTAHAGISLAF